MPTVIVALAFAAGRLEARSRLGAHEGPAVVLATPDATPAGTGWWEGTAAHDLVLEALALLHLPRIDMLVFSVAGDRSGARERLQRRYRGTHLVRNTECRSQTLSVRVQAVTACRPSPHGA